MAALSVQVPYPVFYDRDGDPLDNGNIYIGVANLDPVANPIQVYYDEALTIPASQPLKTSNGYVYRNGTPAQLYVSINQFSLTLLDSKNILVFSNPNCSRDPIDASFIAFTPSIPLSSVNVQDAIDELSTIVEDQISDINTSLADDLYADGVVSGFATANITSSGLDVTYPAGVASIAGQIVTANAATFAVPDNATIDYWLAPNGTTSIVTNLTPGGLVHKPGQLRLFRSVTYNGGLYYSRKTMPSYSWIKGYNTTSYRSSDFLSDFVIPASPNTLLNGAWRYALNNGCRNYFGLLAVSIARDELISSAKTYLEIILDKMLVGDWVSQGNWGAGQRVQEAGFVWQAQNSGQSGVPNPFTGAYTVGDTQADNAVTWRAIDTCPTEHIWFISDDKSGQNIVDGPPARLTAFATGHRIGNAGFAWRATTGGTTNNTSPWASSGYSIGSIVNDGTVIWEAEETYPYWRPDSHDAYAGSMFLAVRQLLRKGVPTSWLNAASKYPKNSAAFFTRLELIDKITYHGIKLAFDNTYPGATPGLTYTFMGASKLAPSGVPYPVQFTQDNSEVYAAAIAAAEIYGTYLSDTANQAVWLNYATNLKNGLGAHYSQTYGYFKNSNIETFANVDTTKWYPFCVTQMLVSVYDVPLGQDRTTSAISKAFTTAPRWWLMQPDLFPTMYLAYKLKQNVGMTDLYAEAQKANRECFVAVRNGALIIHNAAAYLAE